MFLVFDTETTGLPRDYNAPITDSDNWPRMVQLAWQLHDYDGKLVSAENYIIKPEGYTIPYNAEKVHGISTERALKDGLDLSIVLDKFSTALETTKYNVGHNIEFDINVVGAEYCRLGNTTPDIVNKDVIDTKDEGTNFCAIPGGRGGKFKWPTLTELHTKLFNVAFADAHDAAYDVDATAKCFFGLITNGVIQRPEIKSPAQVIYEAPVLDDANFKVAKEEQTQSNTGKAATQEGLETLKDVSFSHLHVHSQFSVLQATSEIDAIVNAAKEQGMPAIALTDHGNMMAGFHFVRAALKAEIIPILGCEFNLCPDRKNKERQNNGFQTVVIAKNKKGYHNLAKLASYANTEGFYYVPRIDKGLLLEYKEDLIVTTGGLWSEIPYMILNEGVEKAEEALLWWKEHFGDDFYIELNRHDIEEEDHVNQVLLGFAEKHNIKYIACNNTYYTTKAEAEAHDVLLCVKDADPVSKPKRYLGKRGREFRYGFPNDEFYIKSQEEMKSLFADLPQAIINVDEIVKKCESYELARDVLLPAFDIPEEFQDPKDKDDPSLKNGENNFLRHLTYEGAKKRYDEITDEITERLDFELSVIRNTGYPGYFLIVQDFTTEARRIGVSVGPGRGSAAGSVVAYCIGITNVDPIKYDLLFERFLNPDRVSMPDIDIDFDDEGRQRVIDYVIEKYGSNQVAQIITYGTMAAKSSIRDTSRVMELPLPDADRIAKLVPDIKLGKLFGLDEGALKDKLKGNLDELAKANELKRLALGNNLEAKVINQARILEGSVRNTGIHACGVIITPADITNYVPVALAKDSSMYCTQFDNSVVEDAGLLKMDFLGLKTLTLIKDAVKNVKERHNIDLIPDDFPLDDEKTYELFQRGETVGIFQYESAGMQKYLRDLKPTVFGDLIAMNALYRPGPLEYIPSFVKRKHGEEPIEYDLDDMQEYLEETYGITVYQEQVMLLSQKLAGFTKGEADMLRKAMGKKILALLEKLKPKFIEQAVEKGHDRKRLEKVWKDWEAFAAYAFNKSHSTCYAYIAFHTAYLKAHYPAEYMASVLSNNMGNIKDVTFFMEECKRMGLAVLGPDVNESNFKFTVNEAGEIRFGLGAIKGAGEAAIENIIETRREGGKYKEIFEFAKRVNLRAVNKKTFESFAMAGAFDCFTDYHRRQYLVNSEGDGTLIEKVVKYANKLQAEENSNQASLFGGGSMIEISPPKASNCEPYTELEKLNIEKEVVGLYITGHPLQEFTLELETFCTCKINEVTQYKGRDISIGGIVTGARTGQTKTGKPFGILTVEDFTGNIDLFIMGKTFLENEHFFREGEFLHVIGRVELNWRKEKEKKENPNLILTDEDWELKAGSFGLLTDLRETRTKGISIDIDILSLNETFIHDLITIITNNNGSLPLNVNVIDTNKGIKVDMISRKFKVEPSNDLLKSLDEVHGLKYNILS